MTSVDAGKLHTLEDVSPKAWNHYGMCLGTEVAFKSRDVNSEMPSNLAYGLWSLLQIELPESLGRLEIRLNLTMIDGDVCNLLIQTAPLDEEKACLLAEKEEERAIKWINTGPPGTGSKYFIPLRWGTFGETEAAKQMTNGSQGMQMMKQEECCEKKS